MVSSCLQDKVQNAWQSAQIFYDPALSCLLSRLTPHTWPGSPPQEADLYALCQQVLCSALWVSCQETGGWERQQSQYSTPAPPLGFFPLWSGTGCVPLPSVQIDLILSYRCGSHQVLVIFPSTGPLGLGTITTSCCCWSEVSFITPFGFFYLCPHTPLWSISSTHSL